MLTSGTDIKLDPTEIAFLSLVSSTLHLSSTLGRISSTLDSYIDSNREGDFVGVGARGICLLTLARL